MVNQGGESTMLGQWRIVLRQAEEAARRGRFEEASRAGQPARRGRPSPGGPASKPARARPDRPGRPSRRGRRPRRRDRRPAHGRATRRTARLAGGGPPGPGRPRGRRGPRLARRRRTLPALERIDDLARHKISGPALRRCREIAEAWRSATAEARRGEFGLAHEHLDRAERLAAGAGVNAAAGRDRRRPPRPGNPPEGRRPEGRGPLHGPRRRRMAAHPGRRRGRRRRDPRTSRGQAGPQPEPGSRSPPSTRPAPSQWIKRSPRPDRPVKATTEPDQTADRRDDPPPVPTPDQGVQRRIFPALSGAAPRPIQPAADRPLAAAETDGPKGRFLLWADAVGGFLVCLDDRIILGRAGPDSPADVPLMGDLSRNHATLGPQQ